MSLLFIASMQDRKDVGLAFETVSKVGVSASRAGSVPDPSAGQKGNQIPSITFGGTWHTCCPRDCQRGAPPPPAIPLLLHMHHAHIEAEHLFFEGEPGLGSLCMEDQLQKRQIRCFLLGIGFGQAPGCSGKEVEHDRHWHMGTTFANPVLTSSKSMSCAGSFRQI